MLLEEALKPYRLVLASKSPRREKLLRGLGVPFEILTREVPEDYPEDLKGKDIAIHIAEQKADAFIDDHDEQSIFITADTIVLLNNEVLTKPEDESDARKLLNKLSGEKHEVITAVCILKDGIKRTFTACTDVWFKELKHSEIDHYIKVYRPLDKAGAYGIQEWIGFIGVTRIEGSYFNVMGLPVQQLYQELCNLLSAG